MSIKKPFNASKTLFTSIVLLGLDTQTGRSEEIQIQDISDLSGVKGVTGNGCLIRDDSSPWNLFNIEKIKKGRAVTSVKFNGFRTVKDDISEIDSRNKNREERISSEMKAIAKDSARRQTLSNYEDKDMSLYNENTLKTLGMI